MNERLGESLAPDQMVILGGRLSVREEEAPKLLLESVYPLLKDGEEAAPVPSAPAPKPETRKLFLRLTRAQMDAVLFILETTPGDIRVIMYLEEEKRTLLAPRDRWVAADFDREGLSRLLGDENIVLKE